MKILKTKNQQRTMYQIINNRTNTIIQIDMSNLSSVDTEQTREKSLKALDYKDSSKEDLINLIQSL